MTRAWRPGGDQIIPRPDTWRHGEPAPWSGIHDGSTPIPLDRVVDRILERGEPRALDPVPADARASAVLIALWEGDHGAEVLLTKRSWELRNHRGEVSFPGGRLDPGETGIDAALREAHEEVGLEPRHVDVIGSLDHIATVASGSWIMPIVARLDRRPTVHAASPEVARVLQVPLAELCRVDTYRQEVWWRPPREWTIHFFELDDETIWGATGRLLVQLLTLALSD